MPKKQKKSLLVILDGWGLNKEYEGNAISLAKTPNFDRMWQDYPTAVLQASGEAVGLPEGQMGNSEVGHFTIGAGHVYFQDLVRINKAIDDGSFGSKKAFSGAFDHVKKHQSNLHLMGLVSNGGVHSHQDHMVALVQAAKDAGVEQVYLHCFLDGRDTLPKSASSFVQKLVDDLAEVELGEIASLSGRFYAMDRDKKWERIDQFFEMVIGKREVTRFSEPQKAIQASYHNEITDEFLEPCMIEVGSGEDGFVKANDAVVFTNFRNDRMLQLSERFVNVDIDNIYLASMSEYSSQFGMAVAFGKEKPKTYLGKIIADAGLKQLRTTETEKRAHMTFFFNCQNEDQLEGEDRIILDSYSVKSHAEKPEMRARDITKQILQDMEDETYPAIMANLCNGDMVGHTGDIKAAMKGCEAVDDCLGDLEKMALAKDYNFIIIADHGNADEMIDEETGETLTAHSTNPVPFILVSNEYKELTRSEGGLSDIAPTMLKLLDLEQPHEMGGESLV